MQITVREAVAADYDAMCALFDEVDALHRYHLPGIFQKPAGPVRERDYYLGLLADANVGFFVAENGNELIGYVHAIIRDTPAIPVFVPRRYAVVDTVLVTSRFHHRGIGAMLMREIEAWALDKGATSIELNVYEFNENAIRFYDNLGYQTTVRRMSKQLGAANP